MKLLRVGNQGKEIPAALDKSGKIRDLSSLIKDLDSETINFDTLKKIEKINLETLKELNSKSRIGPCISKPGNFFAIGLNYKEHAKETGAEPPKIQ